MCAGISSTTRSTAPADKINRLVQDAEHLAAGIHTRALNLSGARPDHPTTARAYARNDREFWQFRPYQSGDDLRAVDWRKSAAGDDILLRDRQRHDQMNISLWLDAAPAMMFTSARKYAAKYDYALTLTLALARVITGHDGRVIPLGSTRGAGTNLFDMAAGMMAAAAVPVDHIGALPAPDGPVILISDFWNNTDTLTVTLEQLRPRHHPVLLVQIADPAEITLPFTGRVRFTATDGNAAEMIEQVDDIRTEYQTRINDHQNMLAHMTAQIGCIFITVQTGDDPALILQSILDHLAGAR